MTAAGEVRNKTAGQVNVVEKMTLTLSPLTTVLDSSAFSVTLTCQRSAGYNITWTATLVTLGTGSQTNGKYLLFVIRFYKICPCFIDRQCMLFLIIFLLFIL